MRVELRALDALGTILGDALVSASGALPLPELATRPMPAGRYEAVFHVANWYRAQGITLPVPAFLDIVPFHFGIADPAQHYHLPLKITPWGISLFRGGA